MRVLLDTHIVLWALTDDPRLSSKARKLIEHAAEIYISAATFWEMAIKIGLLLTADPQVAQYTSLAILV